MYKKCFAVILEWGKTMYIDIDVCVKKVVSFHQNRLNVCQINNRRCFLERWIQFIIAIKQKYKKEYE